MTALSLVIIVVVCLVGYHTILIGDVLKAISNLNQSTPSTTPTNLEGKLEYDEVELYTKYVKEEFLCFIKYKYDGQVIRENEVSDFFFDIPPGQHFKFLLRGMTGYI